MPQHTFQRCSARRKRALKHIFPARAYEHNDVIRRAHVSRNREDHEVAIGLLRRFLHGWVIVRSTPIRPSRHASRFSAERGGGRLSQDGPSFILSSKADAGGIPQKGSYLIITGGEEKGSGAESRRQRKNVVGDSKLYINQQPRSRSFKPHLVARHGYIEHAI